MIKIVFFLISIFYIPSFANSSHSKEYKHKYINNSVSNYEKIFIREYTYVSTYSDTKLSSKIKAIQHLKLILSEEIGIVIESSLNIEKDNKNKYIKQEINTLSVSITKLKVLKEKWNGKSYYIKAEVKINEKKT